MINFFIKKKKKKLFIKNKKKILKRIILIIKNNKKKIYNINFIFCKNKYILNINNSFLKKKEYTDTISFNYSNNNNIIYGDIFISFEQIYYNSILYKVLFDIEMKKVIIHSILHLIGFDEKKIFKKTNFYFKKYKFKKNLNFFLKKNE
ncbi:MAG: rRNA maturation RNase YbeY [Candidatus Shikimatogenerans bostrichidophilus]|nr:MAG: rRNA maturation RNase YbeY [Candidatus Shikimatogenerans bostrichidophilus]